MKIRILQALVVPVLSRLGTAGTALMLSKGVPPETVDQIVVGATALVLLGFDLAVGAVAARFR